MRREASKNGRRRRQDENGQRSPYSNGAPQRNSLRRSVEGCRFRGKRRQNRRRRLARHQLSGDQARLKTSVPFVPPNPNEFFSATSIFISRAVLAQ